MVVLTLGFATGYSAFSTNITLNAKGNIKEKSRIIRSWTRDSVDDFHNSQYRENIVTITFLDSTTLPSNVENSWDVSADGKGGVIAYVKMNEEDHTKYDLFIGAKNGVIANSNSSHVFYGFSNLNTIYFNNNYDTSDAINMYAMFAGGNNITELDLSTFNTRKVNNMVGIFSAWDDIKNTWGNRSIKKIIFGDDFDTSHIDNMQDMFAGQPLTSIDLSKFNTSNVTYMYHMFNGCNHLVELDLSTFDTNKVYNMREIFAGCPELKTIYVSNSFTINNVDNSINMFIGDTKLVGGNGTIYDSNHIDKEYARIDTSSTPGYFTLKQ